MNNASSPPSSVTSIRDGSSLYYSLLWTEPAARQRFIERLNLIQTLGAMLEDVQEPQIAERKIHWWHEELQRMAQGNARHPATQACQASLGAHSIGQRAHQHSTDESLQANGKRGAASGELALEACLNIVSAVSTERFTPPATVADVNTLLEQSYTARLALLAHALSEDSDELDVRKHSALAARALGRHEQLSRLPRLIRQGQSVFSEESYQQFGIRPADLASHIRVAPNEPESDVRPTSALGSIAVVLESPGRSELINAAIATTLQELQEALHDSTSQQLYRRAPLLPLWRLMVLREKQLALWHRKPPDLLRERSTLTPLHKLFCAWRNRY